MPHPTTRTPGVLRRIAFGTLLLAAPLPLHAQVSRPLPGVPVAPAERNDPKESDGFLNSLLVTLARGEIGRRYIWGGDGPESGGFDCSGFTRYVLHALNISLPRTAHEQSRMGEEVPRDISRLRAGDLLTFGNSRRISHIGMYIGNGRVVHASSHYGRVTEVAFHPGSSLYRRWYGVRRVVAQNDTVVRRIRG